MLNIPNELTAKVMGEIISKGMSMSGVDLSESVKSEALDALFKIRAVVSNQDSEKKKISSIEKIMEEYKIL